jgi:outer membrane protein assembly factor BamE (lipoprotein component of BamABCDE complex)
MSEPSRRTALVALAALSAAALAGCDYVAQKKLVAGQHSEHDVRTLMGVPTMVWDRPDGGREWDYVRAPQGVETIRVAIGPDGRYQGMRNLLTAENFAKARPGMTGDELVRLLSKPTSIEKYPLKPDVTWTWRYQENTRKLRFNAHFDPATGRAARFSTSDDPQEYPGGA